MWSWGGRHSQCIAGERGSLAVCHRYLVTCWFACVHLSDVSSFVSSCSHSVEANLYIFCCNLCPFWLHIVSFDNGVLLDSVIRLALSPVCPVSPVSPTMLVLMNYGRCSQQVDHDRLYRLLAHRLAVSLPGVLQHEASQKWLFALLH